jgi:hypothetical protein
VRLKASHGGRASRYTMPPPEWGTPPRQIAIGALNDVWCGDLVKPDLAFRAAPAGVMRLVDFMHRVGGLKHRPASWRDLFLPEARDLPGT